MDTTDMKYIQAKLHLSDLIAEQFGCYLAKQLKLKSNKEGLYDIAGGTKSDIGLAKTVTRWFIDYFDERLK